MKKGLCEHCCEYAMSDDDLWEMVEFRGYKMTDRMTEAFEEKSDNFNKCTEKLLNISLLIEEFESGKLDSEKTMRLIKDIVEAPVYP
jgi:CRISPR/Cas system CMR-associated protein Cmr5 small subunit